MLRDAVKLKRESNQAFLACETLEAPGGYHLAKRNVASSVAETKTQALEEFGEAMENDLQTALRKF